MATLPLFNNGDQPGVAKPNAPVLDRERRPRVDASGIMSALGQSAQAFAEAAVDQPTMDPNTFTGQYAGLSALGQGVENLASALGQIALKRAEAKNYADVAEEETRMLAEREAFNLWKDQNPNPETWGPEWTRRMEGLKKGYQSRTDLAPQARAELDQRYGRFFTLGGLDVERSATKATFERARAAGEAKFLRAVEAKDFAGASATAEELHAGGYIFEDDMVSMQLRAKHQIEQAQLGDLSDAVAADLNEGFFGAAKNRLAQAHEAGLISAEELRNQVTGIEQNEEYRTKAEDAGIEAQADPKGFLADQDAGKYGFLNNGDNYKLRQDALRAIEEQRRESLSTVRQAIDIDPNRGNKKTVDDYTDLPALDDLSDTDKALLNQYLSGERINDMERFNQVRGLIWSYDPATDPNGTRANDIRATAEILFTGERRDEILSLFDEQVQFLQSPKGFELAALQSSVTDRLSTLQDDVKAGRIGDYRVPGTAVEVFTDEKTGQKLYGVLDPNGTYEKAAGFFGGVRKYRIVELSESDRLNIDRWKAEKKNPPGEVDDLKARDDVFREAQRVIDSIRYGVKSGELKSLDEVDRVIYDATKAKLRSRKQDALDSFFPSGSGLDAVGNSLFPDGQIFDANAAFDQLFKAQ